MEFYHLCKLHFKKRQETWFFKTEICLIYNTSDAKQSGIDFINLFSGIYLSVYRIITDFCVLILYLSALLNSLMSLSSFLKACLGFSKHSHVICKEYSFNSLPIWISLFLFLRQFLWISLPKIRKSPHSPYPYPSEGRQNENHNNRKLTKLTIWITALSNSLKLWGMLCRATQDGQVLVESSERTWSLVKGMANHFSILALRTPWTVWKGKKIWHWKMNTPGW